MRSKTRARRERGSGEARVFDLTVPPECVLCDLVLPLAAIATGFALLTADLASASRLSHATCSFPRMRERPTLATATQKSSRRAPRSRSVFDARYPDPISHSTALEFCTGTVVAEVEWVLPKTEGVLPNG